MVYTHGGLAFLIPYFIFLIVLGIPIFFIEVVIGQYSALTPITVFGEMAPLFRGNYLKTKNRLVYKVTKIKIKVKYFLKIKIKYRLLHHKN